MTTICPFPGDLADVVRREGAGGEEVVAAAALEAANQLTHVRRIVVLGGARRAQLRRPKREFTLWGPIPVQKTSFDHMSPKYITKTFKEVFKGSKFCIRFGPRLSK